MISSKLKKSVRLSVVYDYYATDVEILAGMARLTQRKGYKRIGDIAKYTEGGFALYDTTDNSVPALIPCRETLGTRWRQHYDNTKVKLRTLCFFGTNICDKINHIDEFFQQIENLLDIPESKQTVFHATINGKGIIIDAAPFWVSNSTRFAVFSLMLRCAGYYYPNNLFQDQPVIAAFNQYLLTRKVIKALMWFLDGNTKPTIKPSRFPGFISQFEQHEKSGAYTKWLVKP